MALDGVYKIREADVGGTVDYYIGEAPRPKKGGEQKAKEDYYTSNQETVESPFSVGQSDGVWWHCGWCKRGGIEGRSTRRRPSHRRVSLGQKAPQKGGRFGVGI